MFNPIQTVRDVQQRVSNAAATSQSRRPPSSNRSDHRGRDGVTVSAEARQSEEPRGFLQGLVAGISDMTNRTSEEIQSVSDAGGRVLGVLSSLPGRAQSAGARWATRGLSNGLEFFGRDREARAVRRNGEAYSRTVDRATNEAQTQVGNFVSGIGDGVGDIVEDAGVIAANPGRALSNVSRMANAVNPISQVTRSLVSGRSLTQVVGEDAEFMGQVGNAFVDQYRETQREHGTAGAAGRVVFDVLSTIGTGGTSTAVRGGARVAATGTTRAAASAGSRITSDFLGIATDLTAPITQTQVER